VQLKRRADLIPAAIGLLNGLPTTAAYARALPRPPGAAPIGKGFEPARCDGEPDLKSNESFMKLRRRSVKSPSRVDTSTACHLLQHPAQVLTARRRAQDDAAATMMEADGFERARESAICSRKATPEGVGCG
jgi:hypothetical protein